MVPFPCRMELLVFLHGAAPIFLVRVLRFQTYICLCRNLLSEGIESILRSCIPQHNLGTMYRFGNSWEVVPSLSFALNPAEMGVAYFALVSNKIKRILYRGLRAAYTSPMSDIRIVYIL